MCECERERERERERNNLSFFFFGSTEYLPSWVFTAKAILFEEQQWYYLAHSWRDKVVLTFPKGMNPKGNVIVGIEFEIDYFEATDPLFSHYVRGTNHECLCMCLCMCVCVCVRARVTLFKNSPTLFHYFTSPLLRISISSQRDILKS